MAKVNTAGLSKAAIGLITDALTPSGRSERRSGVDYDVAAARIMLAKGSEADKDAAIRALADAARNVATRADGAYVSIPRRLSA